MQTKGTKNRFQSVSMLFSEKSFSQHFTQIQFVFVCKIFDLASCLETKLLSSGFVLLEVILVGVFEENTRLLQWLVFFVSSTRSVHFFVHLFNIINLNYGRPKHTRNDRTSSKTKTSTSRTSKT